MLIAANASRLISIGRSFGLGASYINSGARRENFEQTGAKLNWSAGEHTVSGVTDKTSVPDGAQHPVAWVPARKSGGLASRNEADFSVSVASATIAAGRNIEGATTVTVTVADAQLELVVSAEGTAAITFTLAGELAGALFGVGESSITVTVADATLGAIVDAIGSATATLSASGEPSAIGHLAGDITPFTELSPQSLAAAVWERVIEAGYTAEQIVRIIAAHAAGAATGLEGANPQFTGLDGSTVRIDGSYSAGTRTIDALDGD